MRRYVLILRLGAWVQPATFGYRRIPGTKLYSSVTAVWVEQR